MILGGEGNEVVGNYSTAGGRNAKAVWDQTWVWSDYKTSYSLVDFIAQKIQTFLIRVRN